MIADDLRAHALASPQLSPTDIVREFLAVGPWRVAVSVNA